VAGRLGGGDGVAAKSLAWAKSVSPAGETPAVISWWWRLPLLLLFMVIGAAPWLISAIRRRARKAHSGLIQISAG
jgi:hypothetical protein